MPEKRGFAHRHRSSSFLFPSCCKLLPKLRIARYLPCARRVYIVYLHTCVVLTCARSLTYREEMPHTRTHACIHPSLILLEATDAPISARVSFVIRENVNQSPGPRRLLFLRASSLLLYSLVVSRMYVYECVRMRMY